jgi:hypothetical protein
MFSPRKGTNTRWNSRSSPGVPTREGSQFEVLFRLYGPQKPFFEKKWKLPDIELLR